jgi:hypothetical protein
MIIPMKNLTRFFYSKQLFYSLLIAAIFLNVATSLIKLSHIAFPLTGLLFILSYIASVAFIIVLLFKVGQILYLDKSSQ